MYSTFFYGHYKLQVFLFCNAAVVPTLPKVSVCKSHLQKPVGLHLMQDKCVHRASVIIQFLQKTRFISFLFGSNTRYEAVILFH